MSSRDFDDLMTPVDNRNSDAEKYLEEKRESEIADGKWKKSVKRAMKEATFGVPLIRLIWRKFEEYFQIIEAKYKLVDKS